MKALIVNKKNNIKYKEISSDYGIKSNNDDKQLKILTKEDKLSENSLFVKDNSDKIINHKNKVINQKESLIKDNNEKDKKDNYTEKNINKEHTNITKKSLNHRYNISKRAIQGAEYVFDDVIENNDDLGIETIRKSKKAIKNLSIISSRAMKTNKIIGKNVYKITTSESAKDFYKTVIKRVNNIYENTTNIVNQRYL